MGISAILEQNSPGTMGDSLRFPVAWINPGSGEPGLALAGAQLRGKSDSPLRPDLKANHYNNQGNKMDVSK